MFGMVLVITLAFVVIFKLDFFSKNNSPQPSLTTREGAGPKIVKIGNKTLNLEIADMGEERVRGLSGRESLPANTGLLFVFEKEEKHGIWMKDMNFPIDIAWLDKNKQIIHIEHNVSPDTYPKIFTSNAPALYILEVNASFFEKSNIKIGDTAKFD
ncbi:MAG TPA: DUF192 domain-containing protein [Candidatus Paceibacterota bacterium]